MTIINYLINLFLTVSCCYWSIPSVDEPADNDNGKPFPVAEQEAFPYQSRVYPFNFSRETTNPENGMASDRYPAPHFASIAAVGFRLTGYSAEIERAYVTREYGFRNSFNLTYIFGADNGDSWFNSQYPGIDPGPVLLRIENFYSDLI